MPVCSNGLPLPSHILLATGVDEADARSSLRVTLGHTTTQVEVDAFVGAIGPVVERARARSVRSGGPIRIRQRVAG